MSAIVSGLDGGDSEPFKLDEPSSGGGDPRSDPGGLAAMLAAQANNLKPAGPPPEAPAGGGGGDPRADPGGLAAMLAA